MDIIFLIIAFILALTLHEFAHAWMSNNLGDTTAKLQGRLSLNPLRHVDPIMTVLLPLLLIIAGSPIIFGAAKPVPYNPWALRYGKWGSAFVAASGPITNLLIAIFFAGWIKFISLPQATIKLFITIIMINIALAIFNLIPLPPLDGSRILYAIMPTSVRNIMDTIERSGFILILIILILLFPYINKLMINSINILLNIFGINNI